MENGSVCSPTASSVCVREFARCYESRLAAFESKFVSGPAALLDERKAKFSCGVVPPSPRQSGGVGGQVRRPAPPSSDQEEEEEDSFSEVDRILLSVQKIHDEFEQRSLQVSSSCCSSAIEDNDDDEEVQHSDDDRCRPPKAAARMDRWPSTIQAVPNAARKVDLNLKPSQETAKKAVTLQKPQLAAYFSVRRRPTLRKLRSDPNKYDKYESGAFSDGDRCDLDSIETILGELDFAKFRRGPPPPRTPPRSRPTWAYPPVQNQNQKQTQGHLAYQAPESGGPRKSNREKLRELRELTEKLKPAIARARAVELEGDDGEDGGEEEAPRTPNENSSSWALRRRRFPAFRSASVSQVDDAVDDEDEATEPTRFVWSRGPRVTAPSTALAYATLPRRKGDHRITSNHDMSADEGLGPDSSTPLFAAAHARAAFRANTATSSSAPSTPGHFYRTAVVDTDSARVEAALAKLRGEDSAGSLTQSLDKRRRRRGFGTPLTTITSPAGSSTLPGRARAATTGSHPSSGAAVGTKNGNGRSLTYPPQRRASTSDREYSVVDSNGLRALGGPYSDVTCQDAEADLSTEAFASELSLADSHLCPSEGLLEETYGDAVRHVTSEPAELGDDRDRGGKALKKKHYSDPGGEKSNEGLLDIPELISVARSEPRLPDARSSAGSTPPTDRDPFDEKLEIVEKPNVTTVLSPGTGDRWEGAGSPEKGVGLVKSPQQQRRYSKKRLRGPYGEMLEEEMRKSGEKHLQRPAMAQELSFLKELAEQKSCEEAASSASAATLLGVHPEAEGDSIGASMDMGTSEVSWCTSLDTDPAEDKELETAFKKHQDTRTHVVAELYDTEKSYVESLQILVNKYFCPLKSPEHVGLVDCSLVDDMFFQVPEILAQHEQFLAALRQRLENWDNKQKIGDVFVEAFTKQNVIDTYTAFINNWKSAKEAIKFASHAKPAFAKFLEHMAREHKGKLTLDALLIMPVQRIPRYELLLKELLKHTQVDHPDHKLLVMAQKEVHDLAVKINCMEREAYEAEQMQLKLKDIEGLIDGLIDLVQPDRTFLRYDLVTMSGGLGTKKERCLFLFSDILIITSIKRKGGTMRKTSSTSTAPGSPSSMYSLLEMNKYKLLMRISLGDLEVARSNDTTVRRVLKEIEELEEDAIFLGRITELVASLNHPQQSLEDLVREILANVGKQLQEKQSSNAQLLCLELSVSTQSGVENLSITFSGPDKRASWEPVFNDAKHKLALLTDRRSPPEFMFPLPIRKTRAGLQFTCASPTLGLNCCQLRDVWVCNSDGYVGQVCVLSLQPEPAVTSCNGVCNARILCIVSVPAAAPTFDVIPNRRSAYCENKSGVSISIEDVDEEPIDLAGNIQLDSSESSDDEDGNTILNVDSPDEDGRKKGEGSPPVEDACRLEEVDHRQPTMWLGTEDGCIQIYNCSDNIRTKKNKVKLQHPAAIYCITHIDGKVFASLANGDVTVYRRDPNGGWRTDDPVTLTVGSAAAPVARMMPVQGKLWCCCQNHLKIVNTTTLQVEHSFPVNGDTARCVFCMASSGLGVWVSTQNSAVIKLVHATSYESLLEVNVSPAVTKMLAGCDDIIRQHKAACLRVTSLLACKDLLWVGTSAGVILNVAIPHITPSTSKLSCTPNVVGIPHGHTGHVRFLNCVEMTPSQDPTGRNNYARRSAKFKDGRSRRASMSATVSGAGKMLIISGGDGYEDFRNTSVGEAAGRDDSTNHLLLWQV